MSINERIKKLRDKMNRENIDVYYIPTNDYHSSEYVGEFFKCREFISGFDGSAGTVIITKDEAGLWTDGRYFIQAASQLKDTEIVLYRMGEEGVPKIKDFLLEKIQEGMTLGFDGRTVSSVWAEDMKEALEKKGAVVKSDIDLVGDIWSERPVLKSEKVMVLDVCYAGQTREDKIKKLREYLKKNDADCMVLTALDDIAWLLNIRGNDVHCNPVVLSYLIISAKEDEGILLFADESAFEEDVKKVLAEAGVKFQQYDSIYEYVKGLKRGSKVILDKAIVNYAIAGNIPSDVKVMNKVNPTMLWKAVKNKTETENIKKAHIKDGAAVTKFIYWIKTQMGKEEITEISASEKLESIRSKGEHYIGPSFDTIAGFGEHGAIVHYSATPETDIALSKNNMLLVDTGGHYLEGTTDITRTIFTGGSATDVQKKYYTAVLRGNLNLNAAHFKYGCSGVALDYLARKPLWDMGCDYNHGTGHGVGYLLNVHESPNAFRYRVLPYPGENAVLEEGMVTSDEPGIYLEGQFGIRLENMILCVKREKTEFGQFMGFDCLTYVPFDRELINADLMSQEEKELLNKYHEKVYDNISEYLTEEEKVWLRKECEPVK